MGEWQSDTAGLNSLDVSVAHLINIKSYLDILSQAIMDDLRPVVDQTNRMIKTGGDESPTALGAGIPIVAELSTRIEGTFQAIDTTLKNMATQLEKDGNAIKTIAEKYQAAEDRNGVTAAEFLSAMNG